MSSSRLDEVESSFSAQPTEAFDGHGHLGDPTELRRVAASGGQHKEDGQNQAVGSYQAAYDLWQQQIGRLASLRWRLTVMLGFILLCTLLVISLIVATFVRNTEANTWLERQKEATNYAEQSVLNLVRQVSTTLNLINAFDLNELETESDILRNIVRNNGAITEVAYFNALGAVVANATLDNLQLLIDPMLTVTPSTPLTSSATSPATGRNTTSVENTL
ncbi:MAG TPA: hypothetical protein P5121_38550, partial [Caldilineaceae bacterium]|nr:hypothetical protein [Caldilineaceae bacterium]